MNINECASNPCLNQGTCLDDVSGYTCHCALPYTGECCGEGQSDLAGPRRALGAAAPPGQAAPPALPGLEAPAAFLDARGAHVPSLYVRVRHFQLILCGRRGRAAEGVAHFSEEPGAFTARPVGLPVAAPRDG